MTESELRKIIKNSTEGSWILQNNRIVYKNDLSVSVTLGSVIPRQKDEHLKGSQWDKTFNEYECYELITLEFRWNNQIGYTSNWLYKDKIVIPVPVGANMIHEFFQNERDIAALLSSDRSRFENEMKNSKLYTGDAAVL
ncbi:TPA: hypothetical protein QCP64_005064 [Bacillus cereus]|nr:hypothetical protein [Bacillus cereus]